MATTSAFYLLLVRMACGMAFAGAYGVCHGVQPAAGAYGVWHGVQTAAGAYAVAKGIQSAYV